MMKFWPSSLMLLGLLACQPAAEPETKSKALFSQAAILAEADRYLSQEPVPLTDTLCARSEGGPQDFYSEGDYWWPDPEHPDGPYIRKDGLSNPGNFVAHRRAMRNLSRWVASLTAAYLAIEEDKYAAHALKHLRAWFLNPDTRMNPHLLYGQAIKGRVSGRGIGIIDSIHLIEVARSIQRLQEKGYLKEEEWQGLRDWFVQYTDWLTTHPYGLDEKDHGNNHSTWWAAQVAVFADLVGREDLLALCRDQFKKLLSEQMDEQGAF
ncbi:MAG: alginate lyase family protein, partial [Bacteroidota bacterium]